MGTRRVVNGASPVNGIINAWLLIGSWVLRVPFSGVGAASAALMGFRHTLFITGPVRVPGEAAGIN